MKKLTLTSLSLLAFILGFAQEEMEGTEDDGSYELKSKKGEVILPEGGDWGLGMDATPFLNYAGNLFNSSNNTAPNATFLNPNLAIAGKYYVDSRMAFRGKLRLGIGSNKNSAQILEAGQSAPTYPDQGKMVEDEYKRSATNVVIGGGLEMRKGDTRLQGFYGGELMIGIFNSKETYTYGNDLNSDDPVTVVPGNTTTDFGNNIITDPYGNTARVLVNNPGGTFGLGLRAFVGAEYFVLPKLSIGAEFGWGIGFSSTGDGTTTYESVSLSENEVGEFEQTNLGSSSFAFDTDVNGMMGTSAASLYVFFHF